MTYAELKAQFNALIIRSDITAALTILFIGQGITRIQRELQVPGMEKLLTTVVSLSDSGIDVPADYIKAIQLNSDDLPVEYIPMRSYQNLDVVAGQPIYWTRKLARIVFWPTPPVSAVIKLYYYGEFDEFASDSSTTVLSASMSDLVLYAALSYAADYYSDDRADRFEARFVQIRDAINDQGYNTDGPTAVQAAYQFPDDF